MQTDPDTKAQINRYLKASRLPKPEKVHTEISSHNTKAEIEACFGTDRIKDLGLFYGMGDGGKGPMQIEIGATQLMAQLGLGKHTTTDNYFNILKKKVGENTLVWNDEIYLEFHRGTKTSMVDIKHYMRRAELWAYAAETLQTIVNLYSSESIAIDKSENFEMWREILFNQFHDILPGSSIPEVYDLAIKELKNSIHTARSILWKCLQRVPTKENQVIIYNPFAWPRSEYLMADSNFCYVENIPAMSIQSIPIGDIKIDPDEWTNFAETDSAFIVENDFFRSEIQKQTGTLISIYLKQAQVELIDVAKSANHLGAGLRVYRDHPKTYPAWNIERTYAYHHVKVSVKESPKIVKDANGCITISTTYRYLSSTATVVFYARTKGPDFTC